MVLIENGFVLVVLQMEPLDVGVDQNQGEGQFDDVLKKRTDRWFTRIESTGVAYVVLEFVDVEQDMPMGA